MTYPSGIRAIEARPRPDEYKPLKLALKGHGAGAEL